MNHHCINLLDEDERHYFSAVETSRWVKPGIALLLLLLAAGVFLSIRTMTASIRDTRRLVERWESIESRVEEAEARRDLHQRVQQGHEMLEGWSSSRFPWPTLLETLRDALPPPADRFQFTRIYFDETMFGIRNHQPGRDAPHHPPQRRVNLQLRGLAEETRVDALLQGYSRNLLDIRDDNDTPLFNSVSLENVEPVADPDATRDTPRHQFNFTLTPPPREVAP